MWREFEEGVMGRDAVARRYFGGVIYLEVGSVSMLLSV